jgi:hypothetical protein
MLLAPPEPSLDTHQVGKNGLVPLRFSDPLIACDGLALLTPEPTAFRARVTASSVHDQ